MHSILNFFADFVNTMANRLHTVIDAAPSTFARAAASGATCNEPNNHREKFFLRLYLDAQGNPS